MTYAQWMCGWSGAVVVGELAVFEQARFQRVRWGEKKRQAFLGGERAYEGRGEAVGWGAKIRCTRPSLLGFQ